MRVFNSGRQTEDVHMIPAYVAREIGQVCQCRYHADLGGLGRHRRQCERPGHRQN